MDQLDVRPDFPFNAGAVEIVNPAGDGVRLWLYLGMALDLALRVSVCCARARRLFAP